MEREVYWIWLQQCVGYCKKLRGFSEVFEDAKAVYESEKSVWKKVFSRTVISLLETTDLTKAKEIYDFCKEHKISIVTPESEFYPQKLREIPDYPLVLYVRGDKTCLNSELSIAVIGSRTCSAYGEDVAEDVVSELVNHDVLIVSGGALGIDSVAHRTAVKNGGKTVLVMGCGHGYGYLPENSELRKTVAQNGALISEYPPFHPVTQGSFPCRNRIISGMSHGVAIIEAAERSGTLNTKNHALKQGRKIFVLPGDIKSGNFDGSNQLVNECAIPIFSGEDILGHYGMKTEKIVSVVEKTGTPFYNIDEKGESAKKRKRNASKKKEEAKLQGKKTEEKLAENVKEKAKNPPEGISKNAEMVYNVMSEGVCELDEITRKSALEIPLVLGAISELEIFGAVSKSGPNTYSLN